MLFTDVLLLRGGVRGNAGNVNKRVNVLFTDVLLLRGGKFGRNAGNVNKRVNVLFTDVLLLRGGEFGRNAGNVNKRVNLQYIIYRCVWRGSYQKCWFERELKS